MADLTKLRLETKFTSVEAGVIKGIASAYGNLDQNGDEIAAGAFTGTLQRLAVEGGSIPMLWSHDVTKPIGKWTRLTDTATGLQVEGKITLDADHAASAYALLKDEAVNGLSVGIYVTASQPREGGGRLITEAELAEISIVVLPANEDAGVLDVKGGTTPKTKAQQAAFEEGDTKMSAELASELDAKLTKAMNRIADLEAKAQTVPATAKQSAQELENKAFNGFLRKGIEGLDPDQRKIIETKALSTQTDVQGAVLVPEDFRAELLKKLTEVSPMRQAARITRTTRGEVLLPKRDTLPEARWEAELAPATETAATYSQQKVPVFTMRTFTTASNELIDDAAFNLEQEIASDFAESFGQKEGQAFVVGNGNTEPQGILDGNSIAETPTAAAGVFDADDLINLLYAVKSGYRRRGAWMMNSACMAEVRKLKSAAGDYLWKESLAEGQPPTILGQPVIEAADMPDPVPNAKAIIFGDFARCYRIIDRVDLLLLRDPFSLMETGAVKFGARMRVGGAIVQPEAARVLRIA
ncbi:MAG: phage major capsid protein [Pseudomonadota bacterium]